LIKHCKRLLREGGKKSKKRRVDKNAELLFAIFNAFISLAKLMNSVPSRNKNSQRLSYGA